MDRSDEFRPFRGRAPDQRCGAGRAASHTRDDPNLPYHLRWLWNGRSLEGRRRADPLLSWPRRHVTIRALPAHHRRARGLGCMSKRRPRSFRCSAGTRTRPPHSVQARDAGAAAGTATSRSWSSCTRSAFSRIRFRLRSRPAFRRFGSLAARLGLCWSAGEWDPARSVPVARAPARLRRSADALVMLQRGPAAETPFAGRFLNAHDYSIDLMRTGGLILGLDLVITVDTMIAHLAGTLATPVWLLLRKNADWRWMDGPLRFTLVSFNADLSSGERRRLGGAPAAISRELTRRGED